MTRKFGLSLLGVALLAIGLGIVAVRQSDSTILSPMGPSTQTNEKSTTSVPVPRTTDPRINLLKKGMRYELSRDISSRVQEEEEWPEPPSAEKMARISAVKEKTDPVYFKMAPRVLEEMWRSENTDAQWNDRVKNKINQFIDDERIAGAELAQLDCRDTLCKVQFDLPPNGSVEDLRGLWATLGPQFARDFGVPSNHEDGSTTTTIYFSREGDDEPFIQMRENMATLLDTPSL